ncbi:HK97 family phage prohead protease [Lutibacter aestuarii]|uniref:HK97 family phage prohead protease n=1 Tax=Lutibacter aestuarii TaxID=861111 RepID=A0ABW2ZCD8_9FLAO
MSKKEDYIKIISEDAERRFFVAPVTIEKREEGDENKPAVIEGIAARFNSRTKIGNWFEEEILPGAFDDVLKDDVRCLFNHNPNYVLARSVNGEGTLTLTVDNEGLKYRYETPNVSYANDLAENIRLGNVSQSSFAFKAKEVVWRELSEEMDLRQIVKVEKLYDVSPVTYPAYQDTTVAKRSHDAYVAKTSNNNSEKRKLSVYEAQVLINKNNS